MIKRPRMFGSRPCKVGSTSVSQKSWKSLDAPDVLGVPVEGGYHVPVSAFTICAGTCRHAGPAETQGEGGERLESGGTHVNEYLYSCTWLWRIEMNAKASNSSRHGLVRRTTCQRWTRKQRAPARVCQHSAVVRCNDGGVGTLTRSAGCTKTSVPARAFGGCKRDTE